MATLLKESGLAQKVLRQVWTDAKVKVAAADRSAAGTMNEAEFTAACELAVRAGGVFASLHTNDAPGNVPGSTNTSSSA